MADNDLYHSEEEVRTAYCLRLLGFLGILEGSGEHQRILEDYNTLAATPEGLPRGWKAVPSDDWCAEFLAGQAHAMGLTYVYPMECSCGRIIEIAKDKGIWIEEDSFVPVRGDWVIFDWAEPEGESLGAPEHIGTVYHCDGERILDVEGNKGSPGAVGVRTLPVGDPRIRGFVHPDFSGVTEQRQRVYRSVAEVPEYARAAIEKLVERGLLNGVGPEDLGLTEDLIRMLTINDRAGLYD